MVSRCLAVGLGGAAARRGTCAWNGHWIGNNSGDNGWGGARVRKVRIVEVSRVGAWLSDRCSHLSEHVVGQYEGHHGRHHLGCWETRWICDR